jgi:cathepsin A (carboxypeptidase C)
MIFLDQPAGVGLSYFDGIGQGVPVDNSQAAAQDFYDLLQLFFDKHPEYAQAPFHIAAESYGGIYAPHFASFIHHQNKKRSSSSSPSTKRHINLASVILANAISDPLRQFGAIPEYLCGSGPFSVPPFQDPNGNECRELRNITNECQQLVRACYDSDLKPSKDAEGNREVCAKAGLFCYYEVLDYVTSA